MTRSVTREKLRKPQSEKMDMVMHIFLVRITCRSALTGPLKSLGQLINNIILSVRNEHVNVRLGCEKALSVQGRGISGTRCMGIQL